MPNTHTKPHSPFLFIASGRYVQALDRATGRPVWQRKLASSFWGGSGFATLLVDGHELFVGHIGYVYCLDTATGQVLWERGIGSRGPLVVMATATSASDPSSAAAMVAMQAQQAAAAAAIAASTAAASAAS